MCVEARPCGTVPSATCVDDEMSVRNQALLWIILRGARYMRLFVYRE